MILFGPISIYMYKNAAIFFKPVYLSKYCK